MKYLASLLASLLLVGAATAGERYDLDTAAEIPVFHNGRAKPLQSFARDAADTVYDRESKIRLSLEGYFEIEDAQQWVRLKDKYDGNEWDYIVAEQLAKDPDYKGLLDLFPEGKPQAFGPVELVLSWLIEPEKWERVPFLYAPHAELRETLGVEVETGKLKYVSPREVLQSDSLRDYLIALRDRQEAAQSGGGEFQPTELDKLVQELLDRYNAWRSLAFDPRRALTLSQVAEPGTRSRFVRQITHAIDVANKQNARGQSFSGRLESLAGALGGSADTPLVREVIATLTSLDDLRAIGARLVNQFSGSLGGGEAPGVTLEEARDAVLAFRNSSEQLAEQLREHRNRIFEDTGGLSASQLESFRPMFRELASKAEELHRLSLEMHAALYDEGGSLLVAPGLNPYALAKHRDTENTSQPWISLQAVLYSDELLEGYPQGHVRDVRRAWSDLEAAFVARHEDDGEALQQAQEKLATSLRELGESVEPLRRKAVVNALPAHERDETLLAYTAYPLQWKIDTEVRYNNTDPFKWSWILTMLALVCFCVSFGVARKPMFWAGVTILAICALWTAYGFALRIMVTGWAPVTNMYETVVYVPWVMLILGLWFLFLPLTWTGIRNAWRATAIPFAWEAGELDKSQRFLLSPQGWRTLNWLVQPFRFSLMVGLFYALSILELGDGGRPYFPLLPNLSDVAGAGGMANTVGVWAVGLVCLLLTVWFGPRFILTAVLALGFVPLSWRQGGAMSRMISDVYPRKMFAGAAALGAWFFFFLAWYAPVLDQSFQPLQPVLRSNFWLTIHVLTIVASYGAGMLAWGLGLIAVGYLIGGKYRDPAVPAKLPEGMKPADHVTELRAAHRRPPEQIGVLANYAYRAIQVAVLLLAAGTILGGLWADVSWGRFWGWDPKEVWALISLLVYLAVLHGRFAGFGNHFGLIFGTVFGATMIAMSWYGVNFVLPQIAKGSVGLHSYGEGAGGQAYVFAFIAFNWLLLGIATTRYLSETSKLKTPVQDDEAAIPEELVETE
ncbi:MAG: cytochrome c biogenesis protein CcsA [Planctomycetes bacterium]|nr:cytochrome c biogenesis protein CcsA [Planctomycetota bacterium]